MRPKIRIRDSKGFTLIELMIVIGIITIIAAIAIPIFLNFMKKAKAVEGETALAEVKRLEEQYYSDKLQYTNDLTAIGFNRIGTSYYSISILLNGAGPPPFLYQATATADLDNDPDLDAWVFTLYTDGTSDLKHGCIPGGVGPVDFTCTD